MVADRQRDRRASAAARYGVVVFSPAFFKKDWPQTELDGLVEKEIGAEKVILPIWHRVSRDDVFRYSAKRSGAGTDVAHQWSVAFMPDQPADLESEHRGKIRSDFPHQRIPETLRTSE